MGATAQFRGSGGVHPEHEAEAQGRGDLRSRWCDRRRRRARLRVRGSPSLPRRPLPRIHRARRQDVVAAGGSAEAAEVDALDEQAVDEHLGAVVDRAGRIDISFNAIGIPNPKIRAPLVDLDVERFSVPIATYTRSYFLTARLAARRMVPAGAG